MRIRYLLLAPAIILAACSAEATTSTTADITTIVPDYANSSATSLDAAGVGGAQFPDALGLTTEQKAAIEALHAAFQTSTAADVASLRSIEAQARSAKQAGKSEAEIGAILMQGAPILMRLATAFADLQTAIAAVYTAEQRAWIAAHQPRPCGPNGPPRLTDAQMQQIRALQDAFTNAVKNDVDVIRHAADSAHHAADNGATRDQVQQILHSADAAQARVHAAEQKLQQDLDGVLTAEQRAARCQPQGQGPNPPPHG